MAAKEAPGQAAECKVKRFWIGWSSKCATVETTFAKWVIRARRQPGAEELTYAYAAVVDAPDRETAWQRVVTVFVDAEESFVREKPRDYWPPVDRFPKVS